MSLASPLNVPRSAIKTYDKLFLGVSPALCPDYARRHQPVGEVSLAPWATHLRETGLHMQPIERGATVRRRATRSPPAAPPPCPVAGADESFGEAGTAARAVVSRVRGAPRTCSEGNSGGRLA